MTGDLPQRTHASNSKDYILKLKLERLLGWTLRQLDRNDTEATLLAIIRDNLQLPEQEQQRYQQLWCKCEDETLNEDELAQYQTLLSQLEARNLKRIEALVALARRRGKTLGEITAELGSEER